jgi:hypothetical protein
LKRGIKKKDHERLDDANIQRVKELLEGDKPITKKAACEILNISNNSTRLTKIIQDYDERKARRKANFAKNRGKPLDDYEVKKIISWYLEGHTTAELSEMLYRPVSKIKETLEKYSVPVRPKGEEAQKVSLLPDKAIRSTFKAGDMVWSAKHHCVVEIIKYCGKTKDGQSDVYHVYVFEKTESNRRGGFYDHHRGEDLGSLDYLEKYIQVEKITL